MAPGSARPSLFASVASEGLAGWHRMASVYAAARFAGLGAGPAWILHGLVALAALAAAAWVWHRHADWGARIAALAAATVLASPYMFGYDTLILIAPFAWLVARGPPRCCCWRPAGRCCCSGCCRRWAGAAGRTWRRSRRSCCSP